MAKTAKITSADSASEKVKQLYHVEVPQELVYNFGLRHSSRDLMAFSPRQAFRAFVIMEGGDEETYADIKKHVQDDTEQYVDTAFRHIAHHYACKALNDPKQKERLDHLFAENGMEPTDDPVEIESVLESRYRKKWEGNPEALRTVLGTVSKQRLAAMLGE